MVHPVSINWHAAATAGSMGMAFVALALRLRGARKPLSPKQILIPPLGMSTGFLMFVLPAMRISWTMAVFALLTGALLFSYPLIRGTRYERIDGHLYVKRSKSFVFIMLGLVAVRLVLKSYIEQFVSLPQTGALFFLFAFGMLVPWRLSMLRTYKRMQAQSN